MSDVFVSYSRKDVAFAHILVDSLKTRGLETWIDWEDIPPSADWLNEIFRAIEAADTFVYIVSHHSKNSEVCSKEVQHAIDNHKRLVPIVIQPEIKASELPADIAALNWIFFPGREDLQAHEEDFQQSFDKLLKAIQTDLAWVKTHTRLQVRALEWEKRRHDSSVLLRGGELREAETWLAQATEKKEPQPTSLQKQYVLAGRQDSDRRQRITLGAVLTGLVIAVVLAIIALNQSNIAQANAVAESYARGTAVAESYTRATAEVNAINQKATAEAASTLAVQQRDEAQRQSKLAQAGKLAAQSQLVAREQIDLALLLSVEASNAADSNEAKLSPRLALEYSPRLRHILRSDANGSRPFAISPDSKTLAAAECLAVDTVDLNRPCIQGRVVFIDLLTGKPTGKSLDLGKFSAGFLAYNRLDGGKTLILVGNQSAEIWDVAAGKLVGDYPTGQKDIRYLPEAYVISPDGRLLAFSSCSDRSKGNESNAFCNGGEVRVWDIAKHQLYGQPILAADSHVYALAFSPDSKTLASCSDNTIVLWDVSSEAAAKPVGEPIVSTDIVLSTLAFSPDGKLLASGGSEHVVALWDVDTHKKNGNSLMGHADWVNTLQFSPDGKTLASGSWDDTLILWDLGSRQQMGKPMTGHSDDILQANFSPDGQGLVSVDRKGTLIVWDAGNQSAAGPLSRILPGSPYSFVWTQAFSPDGRILAYSEGLTVFLWDLETNQAIGQPLKGHLDEVTSLVFPPQDNGRTLVSASRDHATITWEVATGKILSQTGKGQDTFISKNVFSQDGSRLVYQSNSGVFLVNLAGEIQRKKLNITATGLGLPSKGNGIYTLDSNPDGSLAYVTICEKMTGDNCVQWGIGVWDILNDRSVGIVATGLTLRPNAVGFSPDGRYFAYDLKTSGQITVVERASGKTLRQIANPPVKPGEVDDVTNLVFSPDGKLLASSDWLNFRVTLWDLASGQPVGQPFDAQYNMGDPVFSPDGKILAWPLEGAPFLWDIAAQKPLGQPSKKGDAGGSLVFSPDGKLVAIGGGFTTVLEHGAQVYDTATLQPVTQPLIGHISTVMGLGFDASGKQLFTFSQDGTLDVWDLENEKLTAQPLAGNLNQFARVSLSPDGRTLAVAGCQVKKGDECLKSELWLQDTSSGKMERQAFPPEVITSFIRFSHNGKLLAIASGPQVILWDVAAQKTLFTLGNGKENIQGMDFSPDDRLLAAKALSVILWDLTTGQPVGSPILDKTTSAKGDPMATTDDFGVAFSPDSKLLATVGSVSGSMLLIDTATGQPYGLLLLDQRNKLLTGLLMSVSFSPDGKSLVTGNNGGEATLWMIDPAAWRQLACATAGRNLTPSEWAVYMPPTEPYRQTCP